MIRLERYLQKGEKRLRMGYTTGTCAAGAAAAAAEMLLSGGEVASVLVQTPGGIEVELEVEAMTRDAHCVWCAVRKDSGDDPDVTDGILVAAQARRCAGGITLAGGGGVGIVTKPGLACPVGEPAINPVPREMILRALERVAQKHGYSRGLAVTLSVPEGERVAKDTFNPRLGIEGGISILGTTGIVEPMSESALLETVRLEIGARRAGGAKALLLTPGNYGRDFACAAYGLDLETGVKCSNFIGEALDGAVAEGFEAVLLLGHGGKLVKLAAGIMNTHSRVADGRMEILCAHGGLCGLPPDRLASLMQCVSVDGADCLLVEWGVADRVWRSVGAKVQEHLEHRVKGRCRVAFAAFGQRGLLMESRELAEMIGELNGNGAVL